jgi:hypothetical protein
MANFNQSNNPVHVQTTSKLTKPVLKHIKVMAKDTNLLKEERINRIKKAFSQHVKAVVDQGNNELMVVSNGELSTRYYINFPCAELELTVKA